MVTVDLEVYCQACSTAPFSWDSREAPFIWLEVSLLALEREQKQERLYSSVNRCSPRAKLNIGMKYERLLSNVKQQSFILEVCMCRCLHSTAMASTSLVESSFEAVYVLNTTKMRRHHFIMLALCDTVLYKNCSNNKKKALWSKPGSSCYCGLFERCYCR